MDIVKCHQIRYYNGALGFATWTSVNVTTFGDTQETHDIELRNGTATFFIEIGPSQPRFLRSINGIKTALSMVESANMLKGANFCQSSNCMSCPTVL